MVKKNVDAVASMGRRFRNLKIAPNTAYSRGLLGKTKRGRKYLANELSFSLHRPVRRRFKRRRTLVALPFRLFQMDLCDMQSLSKQNGGVRYVLVFIDCFTRFVWCVPLKNKGGATVAAALEQLLDEQLPELQDGTLLWADRGLEFLNMHVRAVLEEHGVELYHTAKHSLVKAAQAERVIRTLKSKIFMFLTANFTKTYVDKLQDLVHAYNNSPHSSLHGFTPSEAADPRNTGLVYHLLYPPPTAAKQKNSKLQVGNVVRLARPRGLMEKGFWANWSDRHYIVGEVLVTLPYTYRIKDDEEGKFLPGTYYEQQLQKLPKVPDFHRIERVIRRKGKKMFVEFMGWPDKYNQWVDSVYKARRRRKKAKR